MGDAFFNIEAWSFQLDDFALPLVLQTFELERAARIPNSAQRLRYERGRSALRRVLSLRTKVPPEEITFRIAPAGKPHLAGCEFSISHSGPWLLIVISDVPLGVDVEMYQPARKTMDLAARFFSAGDAQVIRELEGTSRDYAFLRQWVAKEAALKAAGVGLSNHLHKAECVYRGDTIDGVKWDACAFTIREFELPDRTPGAVAWPGNDHAHIQWRQAAEINVS